MANGSGNGNGLFRWVAGGLGALVVVLGGWQVSAMQDKHTVQSETNGKQWERLRDQGERIGENAISITALATHLDDEERRMTDGFLRVETKQGKMDEKLDAILTRLPR